MSKTASIAITSRDPEALVPLGRSVAYGRLALGFAHPAEELVAVVAGEARSPDGVLDRALHDLHELASVAGLDSLRRVYMRVFDPRTPPFPLEAEHRAENAQQRAALLADLMGFYHAFGATTDRQRPDHVACELSFLHLVSFKEAIAVERGMKQKARICARARRGFLKDHLFTWYDAVVNLVRSRADGAEAGGRFYLALADALKLMMAIESGDAR